MPFPLEAERRYCRAVLPRVSRTFALNIRLLRGTLGESVRLGYLLCRAADALEDSWPGSPAEIEDRFARFAATLEGDEQATTALERDATRQGGPGSDIELIRHLSRVIRPYRALPSDHREAVRCGVRTLAAGMARYAARAAGRLAGRPYLDTEGELDDYCWVVAGCVGVMLTRLFTAEYGPAEPALERRRLELAPLVGRALQLTNILLDWPVDVRAGRCYVPAAWLEEHALAPSDLVGAERPEVRDLSARLMTRAHEALARVPDYLDLLPVRRVRYRLFCAWPALWALESLRCATRDPSFPWGPRRPRIGRGRLLATAVRSALAAPRADALRWLYALTARRATTALAR
jgi:phytoene/squalene synthetase